MKNGGGTASSQGAVYKAARSRAVVAQPGTRLAQMRIRSGSRICLPCYLLLAACAVAGCAHEHARPLYYWAASGEYALNTLLSYLCISAFSVAAVRTITMICSHAVIIMFYILIIIISACNSMHYSMSPSSTIWYNVHYCTIYNVLYCALGSSHLCVPFCLLCALAQMQIQWQANTRTDKNKQAFL